MFNLISKYDYSCSGIHMCLLYVADVWKMTTTNNAYLIKSHYIIPIVTNSPHSGFHMGFLGKGCFSENETLMQKLQRSYSKFNFLSRIRLGRMKLEFDETLWPILIWDLNQKTSNFQIFELQFYGPIFSFLKKMKKFFLLYCL